MKFRVTRDMVHAFAALTGDRSSLHVDDAFARRSAYRQPVVHGMLPVGFLPLLPNFHREGKRTVPVAFTGRFLAPVFQGDLLTLSVKAERAVSEGTELDYAIMRDDAVTTSGTVTLHYESISDDSSHAVPGKGTGGLLLHPVPLTQLQLDAIDVGQTDAVDFAVTREAVVAFTGLLASAFDGEQRVWAAKAGDDVYLPNLLAILLYSTSIGVSLPGATATFLEFAAQVERRVPADACCHLRGRITHKSAATRILKKELLVTANGSDQVLVRGKASTLVTKPAPSMPTIEELATQGTSLGLKDRVVLITGASRGIGETTAKLFALHGAKVAVNYLRGADDAQRIVAEIGATGAEAIAVGADVSNAADVASMVAQVRDRFGTIDVLVNNAARDYRPVPFLQLAWDDVQRDLDVIVKGAFLCCQTVIPMMLERGGGRIVNISTIATDDPPPDQVKYVTAKSALVGLTRSLSIEFAARNIAVNMVVPHFVETDFVAHIPDGFRQKIARDIPMQRTASPVDVARAVVLFASSYASFTTGQKLLVTGGGAPYL